MSPEIAYRTRPETPLDRERIREVTLAAFDRVDEADLVDALRHDPAWIDGLSLVATTDDDTVVGHALLSRCHIDEVAALCLAPCSVLPRYQRTGAGTAAIVAALAAATAADESFVVVLGHPRYYPRFGFHRAADHGIHLAIDVPPEALMVRSLRPGALPPAGLVRYAAPFGI